MHPHLDHLSWDLASSTWPASSFRQVRNLRSASWQSRLCVLGCGQAEGECKGSKHLLGGSGRSERRCQDIS